MIAEYRPLIFDESEGLPEEGKCVACSQDLPNPINVRKGQAVSPSLVFPDAPAFDGYPSRLAGLCPSCLGELFYRATPAVPLGRINALLKIEFTPDGCRDE